MKASSLGSKLRDHGSRRHHVTFVEWAHVVLPLLCLGWGVCLAAIYAEAIDRWVARFDAWWLENVDGRSRKRRS